MRKAVKISSDNNRFGILPETIQIQIREPGSAITHFIGFLGIAAGAGPLIIRAAAGGSLAVFSTIVFLLSAGLLYASSTVYHSVVLDRERTLIFRKLDHSMISVLIAGTYTPVCLNVLKGRTGYILLAAIWALAIFAIVLKIFFINVPKWFSSLLYLIMGWLCIFALKPLYKLLPLSAFLWLLSGGIFYSTGALIYALKLRAFNARHIYFGSHEIFHIFIMLGTLCHYILFYNMF